jgi:hypothetical protein
MTNKTESIVTIKSASMKNNKIIIATFILGFTLLVLAQLAFSFTDTIELLKPIDFIHWTLLLGCVFVIPGTLALNKDKFSKIGLPLTLIGIITSIGMCTIDFVLWSYSGNQEARNDMYLHLVNQPAIWPVFISVGPTFFFTGFVIQSFDYIKTNLKEVLIINFGVILVALGGLILPKDYHYIMVIGYTIFAVGNILLLINQETKTIQFNKLYAILFVTGLFFEMVGQLLLSRGIEFVYALQPIDFAHWSLFLGVSLLIPQLIQFPKSIFTYIGIPVIMVGIVSILGMCVLDFIWWSQPTQEVRNQLGSHLYKFPSIWKPFISTGPNFINVGLLILALNYLKTNKVAVFLVILATLTVFFGRFIPSRLIYVYMVTAIGYGLIFFNSNMINEQKTK